MAEHVKTLSGKVPKLAAALAGKAEPQKTIKGGWVEKAALRLAQDVAKIDGPLVQRAVELVVRAVERERRSGSRELC